MSAILEYDDKLGEIVPVDTRNDVMVGSDITLTQSVDPAVSKNLSIIVGATLASTVLKALQTAVNRLASFLKKPALVLKVDGLMGPKTQAATNEALRLIGARVQLPMSQVSIKSRAEEISKLINSWIASKTAKPVPPASKVEIKTAIIDKPAPKTMVWKPTRSEAVKAFQRALVMLASAVNNKTLAVSIDGMVGPKTQTAANLAFSRYVPLPRNVGILPLSLQGIQVNAKVLADAIAFNATQRVSQSSKAAVNTQKMVNAAKAQEPAKSAEIDKKQALALQAALIGLGKVIPNKALASLKSDGVIGPKTQAATNLALSRYVSGVTPAMKSGRLTIPQIKGSASAIAVLIVNETAKRRTVKPNPSPVAISRASALATQKAVNTAKQAAPTKVAAIDKRIIAALQNAVNALAKEVKNPSMTINVDGLLGPKTRVAINTGLSRYVRAASPAMKRGLSIADIGRASAALTKLFLDEVTMRRQERMKLEAEAKAARERLPAGKIQQIEETAAKAASGDESAKEELREVAAATQSEDPQIQQEASDAIAVASDAAESTVDVSPETSTDEAPTMAIDDATESGTLPYTDERKINMPLDMIEDDAELGAYIGLSHELGDTGWPNFRKIRRGIKRGVRSASRAARRAGKVAFNIAKLPLQLQFKILMKVALPLARAMCSLPRPIVQRGAAMAGVDPRLVDLFCLAVRVKNKKEIKRLLPVAAKVAVKAAAMGAAPQLVPILAAVRAIPGIKHIPGMSWIAGGEMAAVCGSPYPHDDDDDMSGCACY